MTWFETPWWGCHGSDVGLRFFRIKWPASISLRSVKGYSNERRGKIYALAEQGGRNVLHSAVVSLKLRSDG